MTMGTDVTVMCRGYCSIQYIVIHTTVFNTSLHAGLGELVTTQQRNIEELGFPDSLHGKADGVFLDLPGPWHVSDK